MNTFRKIIVGTDFNDLATAALRFAATMAAGLEAELVVVYADLFEPPTEFTSGQVKRIAESIARSKVRTGEQLERYVAQHVPRRIRTRVAVAEGAPAEAIAALAKSEQAGLIVLGTHGRGGLQRLVMGSVAESVIHQAAVPVLTLTSTAPPPAVRRILCPVDESAVSSKAAEYAADLAEALRAELTLLHVGTADFDPASLVAGSAVSPVVVRRESADAHPADGILEMAENGGYDLVIIGADHKLIGEMTTFGTTAASLIRHSRTPVLTVTGPQRTEPRNLAQGAVAQVLR